MVGCNEPITVEYEFCIDGNIGSYTISLGDEEIIHEKLEFLLNKRRGVYFECSPDSISINSSIVKEKELSYTECCFERINGILVKKDTDFE